MALFNEEFREMIKDFFSVADSHMLNKLKRGIVVDENDCTSQFTSAVREQFPNHFPITIKAYSQKLPATIEQEWGVDGVILLVDHELNQGKICLFEAKIDRRNWDYIQKNSSPPVSHFSTQLKRQKVPHARGFIVWEQFYTTSQANSLCFMHNVAIEHKGEPTYDTIWRDADISAACELQRGKGLPVNVGEIIQLACECTVGTPFSIDDVAVYLRQIPPVASALLIEKQDPELNDTLDEELKRVFSEKREMKPRRRFP